MVIGAIYFGLDRRDIFCGQDIQKLPTRRFM
jgi:hypothetical protein